MKDIVATVKDINNKGSYEQFLLYEIKNTKFKLDSIRISVRTKAEEGIKIGDQVKLSAKLFPPKIAPSGLCCIAIYGGLKIKKMKNISSLLF